MVCGIASSDRVASDAGRHHGPALKPRAGEWYRRNGPDKFLGSTLDPLLKEAGIKTVIICGNSFQGATVGTGSEPSAATRSSFRSIARRARTNITADAAFHLAKGGPQGVTSNVTLTRSAMVKF